MLRGDGESLLVALQQHEGQGELPQGQTGQGSLSDEQGQHIHDNNNEARAARSKKQVHDVSFFNRNLQLVELDFGHCIYLLAKDNKVRAIHSHG